jgi:hypothetical protein
MKRPVFIIVFITTNNRTINITTVFLYVIYTPKCFDMSVTSSGSFHLCLAKLHKFLKWKVLESQFHNIFEIY